MATLTNTQISVTYVGLLKTSANTVLTSTAQQITDGDGNNSILFLSTAGVGIGGSPASGKELDVTGNVKITGDLIIDNITIDGSTITNDTGDLTIVNTADNGNIIFQSDDASGGIETYFFLDGANTSGNPITLFPDNSRAAFGGAEDLSIYHDPSIGSVIEEAGAGDLFIDTNQAIKFRKTGTSELMAKMTPDDAVELYHDNAIKFSTSSVGANISSTGTATLTITHLPSSAEFGIRVDSSGKTKFTYSSGGFEIEDGGANPYFSLDNAGNATFTENVSLVDSKFLNIGTGNDLQIYHDGTNSFIENSTGIFNISQKLDDGVIKFNCDDGSGGTTRYIQIDGSVEKTFFFKATRHEDNVKAEFGSGGDLEITHDGSDSYIDQVGTGNLNIRNTTDDSDIRFLSDDGSGGTSIYFFLDGSQLRTTFNKEARFIDSVKATFGDSADLQIYHDGSQSYIDDTGTGDLRIRSNSAVALLSNTNENMVLAVPNGAVELYHDNVKKLETTSTGATVTGDVSIDEKIIHSGDTNTFIQFPSSNDKIVFSTNGTDHLTLDAVPNATFAGNVNLADSKVLSVGTSLDLQIFHEAHNSFISNNIGDLTIRNLNDDKDIIFQTDDGSGGTTEYFKLDGLNGRTNFSVDAQFSDNKKVRFGNSADFQLYHTGTESNIYNVTGNLNISNDATDGDIIFKSDDGSGGLAEYFRLDGGETRTIFSKDIRLLDQVQLDIGTGDDLRLVHNSHGFIQNFTGDLQIQQQADDKDILFRADDQSGGLTTYFYLDGSTGNVIFSQPNNVGIGTTSADAKLDITQSSASEPVLRLTDDGVCNYDIIFPDSDTIKLETSTSSNKTFKLLNAGSGNMNLEVSGSLSKGSGSFRIDHPVKPNTHYLYHSFVESPLTDLIYRGKTKLTKGKASINIDKHFGMTDGTFESLVDDKQTFTTNEDSWDAVRGKVKGNELHIECQNTDFDGYVSWLVIGDRKDKHIMEADWTDEKGKPILEIEK